MRIIRVITSVFIVAAIILEIVSGIAFGYFLKAVDVPVSTKGRLDVNDLFGSLLEGSGQWGSATNPYLIYESRHLRNLYLLQNSLDSSVINENSHFQVSDTNGNPCYVGGGSGELLAIPSIGSEDFPFISTLYGVTTTIPANYVTLPSGEVSDTSVFGNIQVTAYEGQVDIGLFGNVGRSSGSGGSGGSAGSGGSGGSGGESELTGKISNLLLSNIQIKTSATGEEKEEHINCFVTAQTHESNHIGILVGHAENCEISEISVYYPTASLKAFDITEGREGETKYTTAGGIIGYYKELATNSNDTSYRVNSLGYSDFGGVYVGLGQGIVYSEDIWSFMEKTYFANSPPLEKEYGIKSKFGEELYGEGNLEEKYFQVGVFTFVHSTEMKTTDRIAKLWKTESELSDSSNVNPDREWSVSTSGSYTQSSVVLGDGIWRENASDFESKKYTCTRIQNDSISSYSENSGYRFMIVATENSVQYALVKYGATATYMRIDTSNFVIPQNQLNYYTFRVSRGRESNTAYPPYEKNASFIYSASGNNTIYNNVNTMQFFVYGNNVEKRDEAGNIVYELDENGNLRIKYAESERPLRIYYQSNSGTISFMAAASNNLSIDEGIKLRPNSTSNSNSSYRLQRTSGGSAQTSMNMSFAVSSGGYFATNSTSGTSVQIYAVKVANSGDSTSPQNANYVKRMYSPNANIKTFDMSQNVLFFTGNQSSTAASYTYDIVGISALNWAENDGNAITSVETRLKMSDPTSYYYISSILRGAVNNIPAPSGMAGTITVPEASIGFTVRGSGVSNAVSKVFVIVATDPSQLVNQTITISYFPTNATTGEVSGDRSVVGRLPLPAIPSETTATAMTVRDLSSLTSYTAGGSYSGSTFTAYPNLNTLLVAFEFSLPSVNTRTYFLEASQGSASFVYLSAERTAAVDSNPDHDNEAIFESLEGIDFVFSLSGRVCTVNDTGYARSLIAPYFGIKCNPANPTGEIAGMDALVVLSAMNFGYSVYRYYDEDEDTYNLLLSATLSSYPSTLTLSQLRAVMATHNFNFSDNPYTNLDTYERVFSDYVTEMVNGSTIDWKELYG